MCVYFSRDDKLAYKHLRVAIATAACQLASVAVTYHAECQQLSAEVAHAPPLQAVQIVLEPSVSVGVAVGELIGVGLAIKAKSKGHDVVLPVVWAAVVIHVFRGYSLPKKQNKTNICTR